MRYPVSEIRGTEISAVKKVMIHLRFAAQINQMSHMGERGLRGID
jgi:hypothetical protein